MLFFFQTMFALTSIWFYLFSVVWVIFLFVWVENEKAFRSAFFSILYLLFLQFFVQIDFLSSIINQPVRSVLFLLGYFLVGFTWSFFKWGVFVNTAAQKYKELKVTFLKNNLKNADESKINSMKEALIHKCSALFVSFSKKHVFTHLFTK